MEIQAQIVKHHVYILWFSESFKSSVTFIVSVFQANAALNFAREVREGCVLCSWEQKNSANVK